MTLSGARVFVLGHRGMLGHVTRRVLEGKGADVVVSPLRYRGAACDELVEEVRRSGARIVVNCLGLIKQKSDDGVALARINGLFPLHLVQRLHPTQFLLHASSDCVFSGDRGDYTVEDPPDADDEYGRSKWLGEAASRWPNASVLRVSIVGPELEVASGSGRGLLAWFLTHPVDLPVPGFTNHYWNGITTLDWATCAAEVAERVLRDETVPRLMQPGTARISKFDLLQHVRDAFGTGHTVVPTAAHVRIDRTLRPTWVRSDVRTQLQQLAEWYHASRGVAA